MDIVKFERRKSKKELHDEKVRAYWALFLLQHSAEKPSADGSYFLGNIENPKVLEQKINRDTPYSPARGLR